MIIDARDGYAHDRNVFDVKRCASVKHCVWVNDETAQWGRYVVPHCGGRTRPTADKTACHRAKIGGNFAVRPTRVLQQRWPSSGPDSARLLEDCWRN